MTEQDSAAAELERRILVLINAERQRHGLKPVRMESRLRLAARGHSAEMERLGYFDHRSPVARNRSFTDRIKNAGLRRFGSAGENLALTTDTRDLARSFVRMWMESPGHRKNLLTRSFRFSGVGVAYGKHNRVYATQLFTNRVDRPRRARVRSL